MSQVHIIGPWPLLPKLIEINEPVILKAVIIISKYITLCSQHPFAISAKTLGL